MWFEKPKIACVLEKVLPIEDLEKLVSFLGYRDSTIAFLLYLGAPSLDEVLSLKISHITQNEDKIEYPSAVTFIPPRLMEIIVEKFLESKSEEDFVFLNRTGGKVNRSRVYKSFTIASEKANIKKIGPAELIEHKKIIYNSCCETAVNPSLIYARKRCCL